VAEVAALAEVRLWDRRVGAVSEQDDGSIAFEYDPAFVRRSLQISPRKLPLAAGVIYQFPELSRIEAFAGLPGVLADALPDRFGNAVIRTYFERLGRPEAAMSPVQKLLYMGARSMGALEFHPAIRDAPLRREQEALEIAELVAQARRIVEGRADVAMPEIMRLGTSAGGARPKAIVLWNRKTNQVRSAFARVRQGDEHWIVKFDGVGELGAPQPATQPYNRVEYAYAQMARLAGITMPEVEIFEERGLAHLLVQRFDRIGGKRLHMHSLGGMEHVDYNQPGAYSYEQLFRLILELNLGYEALDQAYRRACFNIAAVNQDDHVKNISFLMQDDGQWRLAPAYDLTFARGAGFTRTHQMVFNGKRDGFTLEDLIVAGRAFGLKRDGRQAIDAVAGALAQWPKVAADAGVRKNKTDEIGKLHRKFALPALAPRPTPSLKPLSKARPSRRDPGRSSKRKA
jgi:serine/threonine-protein kinase HipA